MCLLRPVVQPFLYFPWPMLAGSPLILGLLALVNDGTAIRLLHIEAVPSWPQLR